MPGRESDETAARKVCSLFNACGYVCFDSTAEEHDRSMAFVQGLNFTSTVAFLAAARDVDGIENFITPSFQRRLDSARKMMTQDMELFEVISEATVSTGSEPQVHVLPERGRRRRSRPAG